MSSKKNVTFIGTYKIVIEDGIRLKAYEKNGSICFQKEKI